MQVRGSRRAFNHITQGQLMRFSTKDGVEAVLNCCSAVLEPALIACEGLDGYSVRKGKYMLRNLRA